MTTSNVLLAPSILDADFAHLADAVDAVEQGGAHWIHLDVMDGHFVPNISFGPLVVRALRPRTRLPLDVHLMIERPEEVIQAFAQAGADHLTVHVETGYHLQRTLAAIRELGVSPGVALNPATPLTAVEEVLGDVDRVLVMTVNPGFGGQRLIGATLDKVRRLKALLRERRLPVAIQVDGGIAPEGTAEQAVRAGADILVAGSAVFKHKDGPAAALQALREAARAGHGLRV
jgi:ribulose-phosphate 3-epimerase